MERLSTSMERELNYLTELQKSFMKLEEHEAELVKENTDLKSEINVLCKQIKELKKYAPHYKPGDIITVQRLYDTGEICSGFECAYTKEDYDKSAKILLENNAFFVELFDLHANPPDSVKYTDMVCAKQSDIIGQVTDYTDHTITIKLYPEEIIPEIGKEFLKRFTKHDFEDRIRVSHKLIIDKMNKTKKTFKLVRIISCYLIDKEKEEILKRRNETI